MIHSIHPPFTHHSPTTHHSPPYTQLVGDSLHEQRHYVTHYVVLVVGRLRRVHGLGSSLWPGFGDSKVTRDCRFHKELETIDSTIVVRSAPRSAINAMCIVKAATKATSSMQHHHMRSESARGSLASGMPHGYVCRAMASQEKLMPKFWNASFQATLSALQGSAGMASQVDM